MTSNPSDVDRDFDFDYWMNHVAEQLAAVDQTVESIERAEVRSDGKGGGYVRYDVKLTDDAQYKYFIDDLLPRVLPDGERTRLHTTTPGRRVIFDAFGWGEDYDSNVGPHTFN